MTYLIHQAFTLLLIHTLFRNFAPLCSIFLLIQIIGLLCNSFFFSLSLLSPTFVLHHHQQCHLLDTFFPHSFLHLRLHPPAFIGMNSAIKDALVRISRSVRLVDLHLRQRSARKQIPDLSTASKIETSQNTEKFPKSISSPIPQAFSYKLISNDELSGKAATIATKNFRRNSYREFLEPLELNNLKTFTDLRPPFKKEIAQMNWRMSKNDDKAVSLSNFLDDKIRFQRMMDLLYNITPKNLKIGHAATATYVEHVLRTQDEAKNRNIFPSTTPRYHFHEVPPIPANLSPSTFQKYIYYLTHLHILYKNSDSLENGLVADILLYTHNLKNTQFKPYRSVHTFNYLIKFFGYDKNQSSFARELLLVMTKDGHSPNIDTINNLLKLCQTHAHIRSLTNTYSIVYKYLNLLRDLGLDINLTTWARVYDLITNIFLKEVFIEKMNSMNLPLSKSMVMRILQDFMKTTNVSSELVEFIEGDFKMLNWRKDSQISNLVLRHQLDNCASMAEVALVVRLVFGGSEKRIVDEYSFTYLMKYLSKLGRTSKNEPIGKNSTILMMSTFIAMKKWFTHIEPTPEMFKYFLVGLNLDSENYSLSKLVFIARGLIHSECVSFFNLPTEINEITVFGGKEVSEGPPENFKIMRRLAGNAINELEGRYLYSKGHRWGKRKELTNDQGIQSLDSVKLIRNPLTEEEKSLWEELQLKFSISLDNFLDMTVLQDHKSVLGWIEITENDPDSNDAKLQSLKYVNVHKNRANSSTLRNKLERINTGNSNYSLQKLHSRGILVNMKGE